MSAPRAPRMGEQPASVLPVVVARRDVALSPLRTLELRVLEPPVGALDCLLSVRNADGRSVGGIVRLPPAQLREVAAALVSLAGELGER